MRGPSTLLFIAANPSTTARLALDEEVRLIEQELQLSAPPGALQIRALWAARPIEVLRSIQHDRPAIVHFAGHAAPAGLLLADDLDGHVAVSGLHLSQLLAGVSDVTRLVVLNACLSDAQSDALVAAVGCAITLQTPIGDVDARRFSQVLYAALARGQPVRRAFDQAAALLEIHRPSPLDARDAVGAHPDASYAGVRPLLRTRPDVDPDRLCLVSAPSAGGQTGRQWGGGMALGAGLAALLGGLSSRW